MVRLVARQSFQDSLMVRVGATTIPPTKQRVHYGRRVWYGGGTGQQWKLYVQCGCFDWKSF